MSKGQLARITFIQKPQLPEWPGGEPGQPLPEEEEDELIPDTGFRPPVGIWPPKLPPLPPLKPGFPIPPTPDFPIAPVPPGGELEPGEIWPPGPMPPFRPEWGTKYIAAALIYVTGLGWKWRWVVLDDKPERPGRPEVEPPDPDHHPGHLPEMPPEREPKH